MSSGIFTLIMNKIIIWAQKIMRQMAMGTMWIYLTLIHEYSMSYEKWVRREKLPSKACLPYLAAVLHCWVGDDHLYFIHNQNGWKCVYYRVGLYGRTICNGSIMGHGSRQVWAQANHHNWRWISVRLKTFYCSSGYCQLLGRLVD